VDAGSTKLYAINLGPKLTHIGANAFGEMELLTNATAKLDLGLCHIPNTFTILQSFITDRMIIFYLKDRMAYPTGN
jgi:hypothetical protein